MTTESSTHKRLVAGALVALVLALAGCGGGSSSSSSQSPSTTSAASTTSSSSSAAGGIPQGPNAGDKDADNQGGPSDGDGNL